MKFAIAAIVRDEFDYLFEWVAWYLEAGFEQFFLADNRSSDGTLQFLEALEQTGIAKVWHEPRREKAQYHAYNGMLERWGEEVDAIAFVDADEFIIHNENLPIVPYLQALMGNEKVGAVAINWRIFGSSGHIKQEDGLVIERFQLCAAENPEWRGNRHIKTVVKPGAVKAMYTHHAELHPGFDYFDSAGALMKFCDWHLREIDEMSPYSLHVNLEPLRINHYVIKSLQEFTEKKRRRGSVMSGPNYDRGHQLFINCDKNEVHHPDAAAQAPKIKRRMRLLEEMLKQNSHFYSTLEGNVDICNHEKISGWVYAPEQPELRLSVNIFVNGIHKITLPAIVNNLQIKGQGIGADIDYGFNYSFEPKLNPGDVVEVSVYANPYRFAKEILIGGG